MRGSPSNQNAMFSYVSLEERVPKNHPLRKLRLIVDTILATMDPEFEADWRRLTSSEHFSVDGTLIDAWASHKRFRPEGDDGPGGPGRNPNADFKDQTRVNDTMPPRLVVDVATTAANGKAEREAALKLLAKHSCASSPTTWSGSAACPPSLNRVGLTR